jgi:hypothetical protein
MTAGHQVLPACTHAFSSIQMLAAMHMRELPFTLAICLASLAASAREQSDPDSTQYLLKYGHTINGLFALSLNSGHTDLSGDVYTLGGFGGGVLIDHRLLLGVYGQGLTMYSFFPHKNIHPFLSGQIGQGLAKWTFKYPYDEAPGYIPDSLREPKNLEDNVMVRTLAVGAEFNVTHWFRPNVYVGLRSVTGLSLPAIARTDLDGFIVGVNLCFGGLGTKPREYSDEFE